MSNTITVVTAKTFKAVLNGDKIDVNYCRFVAMANDVYDTLRYNENNRSTSLYKRAINGYKKIVNKPKYFMAYPYDGKDWEGAVVYKTPEIMRNDDFDGTFDDYDLEDVEIIGTLIKEGNKKVIETDLIVIEKIRRSKEAENIESGRATIYFTDNEDDLRNPAKYIEHLEERDNREGKFITRGHGNII